MTHEVEASLDGPFDSAQGRQPKASVPTFGERDPLQVAAVGLP